MQIMNAFHVFWSSPLEERTCGGNEQPNRGVNLEQKFEDYYLLTFVLSALKYKDLYPKSRLKLYGDSNVIRYLSEKGLLGCWDVFDDTILDRNIRPGVFDNSCFYSVGKFFAYREETAPCILLDVDLVLWNRIDEKTVAENALVFTHWEDVHPQTYWYGTRESLKLPKEYKLRDEWDFDVMAANTSIVCFNDRKFMEAYTDEVIRFMENNFVGGTFNIIKPELLFVEQRLIAMMAKDHGIWEKMTPMIDTVWSCAQGTFTREDPRHGPWRFYHPEEREKITHTWIAKQSIEKNVPYRRYYCGRMIEHILALCPGLETTLRQIKGLEPHFQMLDRYGTTQAMRAVGVATGSLREVTKDWKEEMPRPQKV
ncbi:MAG: hypothetical protein KGZ88_06450 [Methylomicrobium sp.]|nr:hypothetical protein [Methylomicrobium sp.]